MDGSLREVVLDLAPVATESGRVYHPSIVAAVAADGHWNALVRGLILTHELNPARLDVAKFTRAQLVAFIVTAIEAQASPPRA